MNKIKVEEPKLTFTGAFTKRANTKFIVLHHAAASNCTVQDVHRWHLNNGWLGIGYHYFVDKLGKIFRGRPEDVWGAHAEGYNDVSIGICAEGDYTKDTMPKAQLDSLVELSADVYSRYPNAKIVGHYDLNATLCPGYNYPLDLITKSAMGTPIAGVSIATVEQAQEWAKGRNASLDFVSLAPIYWEESAKRNVRADIAYAQSAKETAFGRFGGTVTRQHNNWCGLKTREGGSDRDPDAHAKFINDRTGIIAHIQHLCAYAGIPLDEEIIDPRYVWVKIGSAPAVEVLGGKWAPSADYGISILNDYLNPMIATKVNNSLEKEIVSLRNQVLALTAHRDSLLDTIERAKTILGGV